jgi:hypothetical protein
VRGRGSGEGFGFRLPLRGWENGLCRESDGSEAERVGTVSSPLSLGAEERDLTMYHPVDVERKRVEG